MKSSSGRRWCLSHRVAGTGTAPAWLTGLLPLMFSFAAAAEPAATADAATSGAAGSFASLLVPLMLLVAAGVGATWFVTRSRGSLMKRGGPIRLVHIAGIGPRERLVVVEVDDRRYLIGVTPNQISTLADLGTHHTTETPANSFDPPRPQP